MIHAITYLLDTLVLLTRVEVLLQLPADAGARVVELPVDADAQQRVVGLDQLSHLHLDLVAQHALLLVMRRRQFLMERIMETRKLFVRSTNLENALLIIQAKLETRRMECFRNTNFVAGLEKKGIF